MNIFILIAFIAINAELVRIHEEVKESFEGNNRWTIKNGIVKKEFCNSKLVFGGFGGQTVISKLLIVPTHAYIKISVDIWSFNQWGQVKAYLDHVEIQSVQIQQRCSENDYYLSTFTSEFIHSGASIILVMSGNGEQNDNQNQWGFRNLEISIEQCPQSCQICDQGDVAETCQIWKSAANSWNAAHTNFMGQDGWISINGISGSSKCGGVPLIGGYQRFGKNQGLSKTIRLQPHYKLRLLVLWAKIDSWDNENGLILFDGKQVWNQNFNNDNGYQVKVCGNSEPKYHTLFKRIDITVDHSGDQVKIDFWSSLDSGSDDESFGLRDLQLFYAPCQDQCEVCKGELGSECIRCSNYQFQNVKGCSEAQSFYILERSFYAQKFTSLEGWILKETQQNLMITDYQDKTIVGGQNILGVGATAEKLFILPPHTQLRLEVTLYKIDLWDGENIIIEVDDQNIWDTQRFQDSNGFLYGTAQFGNIIYASSIFKHDKSEALVRIRSTLDEGADNESWGFRDFCLMYDVATVVEISDALEQYLITLGIVMIISFI
ncbi:unnamed protein product (macronuclear) [Paramecium tetraurelia]|uniref:Uncharacterized protein n=1 Tax=Paramecium tetraurelia TaxID=5888 RepID=A0EES1_PARTE|nr:uncharacterized protein GSPATT00026135001 [Paramecium tetraurelia]CAK93812.1 unnamed protein product [Paramecium tetraurelia]|eukprot:XP_001461185.1 hypothetical protein (macronuclear) [Paramecium tetraurelia strain d4-2]